jgi:hypothetical protein
MTQPAAKRPFVVGLMGIIMYLQALLMVVFGALFVATRNNDEVLGSADISSSTALVLGVVLVVMGVLIFLVARGLRHGSRAARNLIAFVELLGIAGAVYAIVTHAAGASFASGAGTIVGALIVLWILFGHEASKRFFAG